jgi:hypothetical protein
MQSDSTLSRNPRVVARELAEDGGGVLLHLDTGAYHRLNQMGFAIWELLDGDRTVAQLLEALRPQISDAPPELDAEVRRFLDSAIERDLIHLRD